jgi:hypothetical protein
MLSTLEILLSLSTFAIFVSSCYSKKEIPWKGDIQRNSMSHSSAAEL